MAQTFTDGQGYMDMVMPNLWIGGVTAVKQIDLLEAHNIKFIISVMRGFLPVDPRRFTTLQIDIDDVDTADILEHFPETNKFIADALAQNAGILVHCQAGMSRSASILVAFLMYSRKLDRDTALELLRQARPIVNPNDGFKKQLDIFHAAEYKISSQSKPVREWYLNRSAQAAINAPTQRLDSKMFAQYPAPTSSMPVISQDRRRIRCKMCRRELALRVHMKDHPGHLSPPNPPPTLQHPSVSETNDIPDGLPAKALLDLGGAGGEEGNGMEDWHTPGAGSTKIVAGKATGGKHPPLIVPADKRPAVSKSSSSLLTALKSTSPLPTTLSKSLLYQPSLIPTFTPIIANPKCSGYFLEAMDWMGQTLQDGGLAGKLICPNNKCKAKIGTYDWAGLPCGCGQWSVPGFCIPRAKVDEVF